MKTGCKSGDPSLVKGLSHCMRNFLDKLQSPLAHLVQLSCGLRCGAVHCHVALQMVDEARSPQEIKCCVQNSKLLAPRRLITDLVIQCSLPFDPIVFLDLCYFLPLCSCLRQHTLPTVNWVLRQWQKTPTPALLERVAYCGCRWCLPRKVDFSQLFVECGGSQDKTGACRGIFPPAPLVCSYNEDKVFFSWSLHGRRSRFIVICALFYGLGSLLNLQGKLGLIV